MVCVNFGQVVREVSREEHNFRKFVRTIAGTPEQFKLWWSMGTGQFLSELNIYVDELTRKKANG